MMCLNKFMRAGLAYVESWDDKKQCWKRIGRTTDYALPSEVAPDEVSDAQVAQFQAEVRQGMFPKEQE